MIRFPILSLLMTGLASCHHEDSPPAEEEEPLTCALEVNVWEEGQLLGDAEITTWRWDVREDSAELSETEITGMHNLGLDTANEEDRELYLYAFGSARLLIQFYTAADLKGPGLTDTELMLFRLTPDLDLDGATIPVVDAAAINVARRAGDREQSAALFRTLVKERQVAGGPFAFAARCTEADNTFFCVEGLDALLSTGGTVEFSVPDHPVPDKWDTTMNASFDEGSPLDAEVECLRVLDVDD